MDTKKIIITGCNGQLGKALQSQYPEAVFLNRAELDISDEKQVNSYDWSNCEVIINAAAYVNADHSETVEGREATWMANALGPRNLALIAIQNDILLIHVSSEYVFDGTKKNHNENELFTPLSVYGQSKAAGDLAVSLVPKHYILRTSWVVGDGHNFVKTMKNLADLRIDPKVVNDQYGRLTFVSELVRFTSFILEKKIQHGTYNVSNSGQIKSWAEIASEVFNLSGHDKGRVTPISTDEYKVDKHPFAPRPENSDMDLSKIQSVGFESHDYMLPLKEYIDDLGSVAL